jgi:hypothetical protein
MYDVEIEGVFFSAMSLQVVGHKYFWDEEYIGIPQQ